MTRLTETLGGLWELARLAAQGGFRMNGPYWQWRSETAFGSDPAARPGPVARARAILAYGRWVWRMRHRG